MEADPCPESFLPCLEFEKAATGYLFFTDSVPSKMVVDGVATAVSPIDIIHVAVMKDIVTVMVVTCHYGLDISHFPELGQKAAIES
jgi:hypothetical protein